MRAPIFYDYNNTGYYADPAGTSNFNYIQGTAQYANYADLAEKYTADVAYTPGTVVVFGGDQEVTISTASHCRNIAGVVSTDPGYLMNYKCKGDISVAVALQGRVPCLVRVQINKGDLVASSDIDGVAQKLNDANYQVGCVIGKSLENINNDSTQLIEVVVGRV